MSWDIEAFRQKVEDQHSFPGGYTFKFIVPAEKQAEVENILPAGDVSFRKSAQNTYISITAKVQLQSSQEVLDVYIDASKIEGCIAL